jgi:hypothetical protein
MLEYLNDAAKYDEGRAYIQRMASRQAIGLA